ncbi:replication initiation protein [Sedimenticola selenatireducens]|uniref:replication initiation protein n=1 Tax=Sedimenticola selenatireducens TaxID=191960 RepID=UPI001642C314
MPGRSSRGCHSQQTAFEPDRKFGKRQFEIGELREILQIGAKQYEKFADFRKRVIEPATEEINERSIYKVEWEKVTQGRKVTGVAFDFQEKQQLALGI